MTTVLDLPDNYPWFPGSKRYVLDDDAELAVRLGSPVVFDRRGQVAYLWDGSNGLTGWIIALGDAGARVDIVTGTAEASGYALRLTAGSVSALLTRVSQFLRAADPVVLGAEASVAFEAEFDVFELSLIHYKTTGYDTATVYLDRGSNTIELYTTGGNVAIDTLPNPIYSGGQFHDLKLVWNAETLKYVRLLYDTSEYDISAYTAPSFAGGSAERLQFTAGLTGRVAHNDQCFIGRCILTVGEPT